MYRLISYGYEKKEINRYDMAIDEGNGGKVSFNSLVTCL